MAGENNGKIDARGVPIIGQKPSRASVQSIGVLIRQLDEAGEYEPEQMIGLPNGAYAAVAGRGQFLTAEDLLSEIRQIVREEIAASAALQNQS